MAPQFYHRGGTTMTDDPDALRALILTDPDATPEDVKGAADSGAVTQAHARAWLVGYLAGLRATPPTARLGSRRSCRRGSRRSWYSFVT